MSRFNDKPETICFKCDNAKGGCPWSDRFEPVDGWTAEETLVNYGDQVHVTSSYCVSDCPMYTPDADKNFKRIHNDAFKPLLYAMLNSMIKEYAQDCIKYNKNPNGDHALQYKYSMAETERYVTSPMFEDIVNVLELCVDGPKLLKLVRADPRGVLERMRSDPVNFRGKQAVEYQERKRRKELNYAD